MKGIALLTMVFLPGTYAAVSLNPTSTPTTSPPFPPLSSALKPRTNKKTFLAMPLFDFSNSSGAPTVKTGFWIYWAITIPLTTIVLGAYLTYFLRIQQRDRLEDSNIMRRMKDEDRG